MITILLPSLIALWIIHFGTKTNHQTKYMTFIKKVAAKAKRKRFRPLDCVKCLSGWLCCGFCLYLKLDYYLILPYMIGAMVLGSILEKIYTES